MYLGRKFEYVHMHLKQESGKHYIHQPPTNSNIKTFSHLYVYVRDKFQRKNRAEPSVTDTPLLLRPIGFVRVCDRFSSVCF